MPGGKPQINYTALSVATGCSRSTLHFFFEDGRDIGVDIFRRLCAALGVDLDGLIVGTVRPKIIDGLNLAEAGLQAAVDTEQVNPDQRREIARTAICYLAYNDCPPDMARIRAQDPEGKASAALKDLAADDALWNVHAPTGPEIEMVEHRIARRRGSFKSKHDWIGALVALRDSGVGRPQLERTDTPVAKGEKKQRRQQSA